MLHVCHVCQKRHIYFQMSYGLPENLTSKFFSEFWSGLVSDQISVWVFEDLGFEFGKVFEMGFVEIHE